MTFDGAMRIVKRLEMCKNQNQVVRRPFVHLFRAMCRLSRVHDYDRISRTLQTERPSNTTPHNTKAVKCTEVRWRKSSKGVQTPQKKRQE